jgi:hypothetical protein
LAVDTPPTSAFGWARANCQLPVLADRSPDKNGQSGKSILEIIKIARRIDRDNLSHNSIEGVLEELAK